MEQVILIPGFYVERQELALKIVTHALVQLKVPRYAGAASARVLSSNITPPGARQKKREPRSWSMTPVSMITPSATICAWSDSTSVRDGSSKPRRSFSRRISAISSASFPENIGKANRCPPPGSLGYEVGVESTNPLSLEDLRRRLQNPGIGFDRTRLHGFLARAQR
jgi:hypothetical protein